MKNGLEVIKNYKDFLDSPAGGATDAMMSILPPLSITWNVIKNSLNGTQDMRILRGLEFFEGLSSKKFQNELLKSNQAMDGLAICFESYFKQRNDRKRKIIKRIFLGFINLTENEKEEFELERFLDITNKTTESELSMIMKIDGGPITLSQRVNIIDSDDDPDWNIVDYDVLSGLIGLGVIKKFIPKNVAQKEGYLFTTLGIKFSRYIIENES